MFEELFAKKKINIEKLKEYGFERFGGEYKYRCEIMEGDFLLEIAFDRRGNLDTSLTEYDTDEEYSLYKTDAQGVFIGQVRDAISKVLRDISKKCFDPSAFRFEQTMQLIEYARKAFGTDIEFPFKDHGTGVLRRADNAKWYAALITIPMTKLGSDSNQTVEIVNLHASKERVTELLDMPHFYPAWHMNKKSWFTVILDGSVDNGELFALLAESFGSVKK